MSRRETHFLESKPCILAKRVSYALVHLLQQNNRTTCVGVYIQETSIYLKHLSLSFSFTEYTCAELRRQGKYQHPPFMHELLHPTASYLTLYTRGTLVSTCMREVHHRTRSFCLNCALVRWVRVEKTRERKREFAYKE